jgi:predicted DsbA family dithiol-disulfide isomerase
MIKEKPLNKSDHQAIQSADRLEVIYYTDPLCCWSWAMEPQLRKLKFEFNDIAWRTCMGGLLPGWGNYNDEVNCVTRPIQMGPVWMHAQQLSGMPMNTLLWIHDPPASSYPACIAVKSATLQSPEAGERYLRLLRESLMLYGKNISKESVLIEVANLLAEDRQYNFDVGRFKNDFNNDAALEAFRKDLQEVQYRQVNRFPTLVFKSDSNTGVVLTGYRPYVAIMEAIKQIMPNPRIDKPSIDEHQYKSFWGSLTPRELEEIGNVNRQPTLNKN